MAAVETRPGFREHPQACAGEVIEFAQVKGKRSNLGWVYVFEMLLKLARGVRVQRAGQEAGVAAAANAGM